MSERPEHLEPDRNDRREDPEVDPLSRGALARSAADGELTPEQARALSQGPGLNEQILFERELRARTALAMREPRRAPDSLRDAVARAIKSEPAGEWLADGAGRVGPPWTRQRSFWRRPPMWAAAAAAAALAVAATTLVLTRSPLGAGDANGRAPIAGGSGSLQFVSLVSLITSEHDRCSDFQAYFEHKMNVREADAVADKTVEMLGKPPVRIRLDQAGYRFAGMGKCILPGPPSLHLVYEPLEASQGPLSVFIQRDGDHLDIESGVCYALPTDTSAPVLIWKHEGLVYYIFGANRQAEQRASRLLGAPDRQVAL